MSYIMFFSFFVLAISYLGIEGCLITNCPRGGKRSEGFRVVDDKACISCGPGQSGKCVGSHICCGPFGCFMGTVETLKCRQDMLIPDKEACDFPGLPCKKNNGKCAADGLCCTHDACYIDKECENYEKYRHITDAIPGLNIYNLMNKYQSQMENNDQ